ncbi:MAG TPA: DNA repair protein RecO [Rubricoccaceae bacterium]|nr:DNA repair protein RecO [Rubricoccaceae bacterium]
MIVRTDAVVLRAFDYGETSRIVTLLTRRHGVLSALARGARRPKSRFGAALQPMAYVQVVYYHKEGRGLQTLKEAAYVARFGHLGADLEKTTVGLRMVELARALLHEHDPNAPVLGLLAHTLAWVDAARSDGAPRAANALPWFQLRLATLLGFAPDVRRGDVEALGDAGVLLLDTGAVVPAGAPAGLAGHAALRASRAALRAFAVFALADLDTAGRLRLDGPTRTEVEAAVDAYLRYHTEDAFPERVRRVADQMAGGAGTPPG